MSRKKKLSIPCLEYTLESCEDRLPPLPRRSLRKRKGSHSILANITNIALTPFRKKRAKSINMGSMCIKEASHLHCQQQQHVSPHKKKRTKISPSPEGTLELSNKEANTNVNKHFYKSDVSVDPVTDWTGCDIDDNGVIEDLDLLPEVFEEAPEIAKVVLHSKKNKENGSVQMDGVDGAVETIGSKQQHHQSPLSTTKQKSLPDLRPHGNLASFSKRLSQGDGLKVSIGCANLLQPKKTFLERRTRSGNKCPTNENVIPVDKRRKRLPTVENGVHMLEDHQVNYYQILEEVGRGSFGSVCKCQSYKNNNYYAMKIISKKRLMRKNRQLARKPGSKNNPLEPLYREVAILKKMDHPNIVKLIEVIDDIHIDNFYMIFELMTNGVVIDVPTDDVIPEERGRKLFRDLVLGIEYLHYSKVIHRDIKPSNLLLDTNDHIKISDFGVSNMFEGEDDLLSKYAGSPAFQAPEVLDYDSRDKYSGKAVDVWAMGVTLYCFLYGRCPFFSNNFGELSNMIRKDLVSFPDTPILNPQVLDLISKMLSKEAKCRITVGEIKEHPWVIAGGASPLPSTEQHCTVIEVTEEEVRNSIKIISKLSSLVLAKSILKGKSFLKSKHNNNI